MQKSMQIMNQIISSKSDPKPYSHLRSFSSNPNNDDGSIFKWHRASAPPPADRGKAAVVILGWLGATPRHLRKYAELYTTRGVDAVTFVIPVRDFGFGNKVDNRIRELVDEIVLWLSGVDRQDRCLIFHAFSNTGWLVYGAILVRLKDRPDLIERIKGCIVDSAGGFELNPKIWAAGFSAAILKKRYSVMLPSSEENLLKIDGSKSNLQDEGPSVIEALLLAILEKLFYFLFKLPKVKQRMLQIISHLSENQPPCLQLYLYSTAEKCGNICYN